MEVSSSTAASLHSQCDAPLPRSLLLGFGVGSLGTGVFTTVPGLLLHFFMVNTLGVPAAMAAFAVFLPKLWIVFADPLTGRLSDRTSSRWGRRRPYLLGGAIASTLFFILLFTVPDLGSPFAAFLYVMVAYLLASTAYSVFAVPYIAMPAEMSRNPREITRLLAHRMTFMLLGVLAAGTVAPQVVEATGGGRAGYAAMAIIIGGFCGLSMLLAFLFTAKAPSLPPANAYATNEGGWRDALSNRAFLRLALTYLLQLTGVGAMTALIPYYASYVAGTGEDGVTFMFLALTGAAILTMPLWTAASERFGRKTSYIGAVMLMALALVPLAAVREGISPIALYAFMAIAGAGFAGLQLFPFAMLPDIIQAHARDTGDYVEGLFTGLWTANEKVGLALGALLGGGALGLFGFAESTAGGTTQSAFALLGVRVAFGAIPAVLLLLSLVPLLGYRAMDRES